jgi:hypothetical protein
MAIPCKHESENYCTAWCLLLLVDEAGYMLERLKVAIQKLAFYGGGTYQQYTIRTSFIASPTRTEFVKAGLRIREYVTTSGQA